MQIDLPITISLHKDVSDQFEKLPSIINKLEAQFNFRTMTAGWYGDENNIVEICLSIESNQCFLSILANENLQDKMMLADDVVSFDNGEKKKCYIAITESEELLLTEHPKLLTPFFDKKLTKVLNLIAENLAIAQI